MVENSINSRFHLKNDITFYTGNLYKWIGLIFLLLCLMYSIKRNYRTNFQKRPTTIQYLTNQKITISGSHKETKWKPNSTSIAEDSALERRNKLFKKLGTKCSRSPPFDPEKFKEIARTPDSNCSAPFVTVNDGGRLGNQICELMCLWIFRKHFGMRILISEHAYQYHNMLFSKILVPHGTNSCFNSSGEISSERFHVLYNKFYKSLDAIKRGTSLFSPDIHMHNFISGYPCEYEYLLPYREEIRSIFEFKSSLIKKAEEKIRALLSEKNLNRSTVILVSVHVRRTDYVDFSKTMYKTELPGIEFYKKAFDLYNKRFDSVVFVVLSDDIDWCKNKFLDYNTIYPGTVDLKARSCEVHNYRTSQDYVFI